MNKNYDIKVYKLPNQGKLENDEKTNKMGRVLTCPTLN